jgi:hypothetical protein
MSRISLLFGVLFIVILTLSGTGTQDQASTPTPEDLARGKSLFIVTAPSAVGSQESADKARASINRSCAAQTTTSLSSFLLRMQSTGSTFRLTILKGLNCASQAG